VAGRAQLLHRLLSQAVQAGHADVLRVFRVLLAEDALVLGCVSQARARLFCACCARVVLGAESFARARLDSPSLRQRCPGRKRRRRPLATRLRLPLRSTC
jgi:hypothetical protein